MRVNNFNFLVFLRWRKRLFSTSKLECSVTPHQRHLIVCTGTEKWPAKWSSSSEDENETKYDTSLVSYVRDLMECLRNTSPTVKITACNAKSGITSTSALDLFLFPESIVLRSVQRDQFDNLAKYLKDALIPDDPEVDLTLSSDAGFLEQLGFNWQSVWRQRHIFICTHGARDVRCGNFGNLLFNHLQSKSKNGEQSGWSSKLRFIQSKDEATAFERTYESGAIQVWKSSHVGGHKYAGNMICYPHGHWFGGLKTVEALESVLDSLYNAQRILPDFWRGRIGLSESEQAAYFSALSASNEVKPSMKDIRQKSGQAEKTASLAITFILADKEKSRVVCKVRKGERILDVALRYGIDGIEGTCGGNLECATCHVYIQPEASSSNEAFLESSKSIPVSEAEEDMLHHTASDYRPDGVSRLCCQLQMKESMNQMVFQVVRST